MPFANLMRFLPACLRSSTVGSMGCFWCGKHAEMDALFVNRDPRAKARPDSNDAFYTEHIVPPHASVRVVFCFRCIAKIVPTIVETITVTVVHHDWLAPGHQFVNHAGCFVAPMANANVDASVSADAANRSACMSRVENTVCTIGHEVLARSRSPRQSATLWIVVETLAEIILRRQREWLSHRILQQGRA